MKLIVQKFGGSSVSNISKIINVSQIITKVYNKGINVVVVVSAQGNTTNKLIEKMLEVNSNPSKREMDVLLAVGEQISIALLTSYLEGLGYPAISLTGWQAGIYTNGVHKNARIEYIDNSRIKKELKKNKIVIIAGFQGVTFNNDISTLGRGGSDTSAVALAVSLNAKLCQIFTDVDGVYTADPRIVGAAKKIDEITFDEMLEMSSLGAQILHNRSVELAKKYNVEIDVISSFNQKPGTRVKEDINLEKNSVRGITVDNNILVIDAKRYDDKFNVMYQLEESNVIISGISLSRNEFGLIVNKDQKQEIIDLLNKNAVDFRYIDNVSKVSIVGSGLLSNNKVLAKLFKVLNEFKIAPYLILTGEIAVSIVIDETSAVEVMNALHQEYKLGDDK